MKSLKPSMPHALTNVQPPPIVVKESASSGFEGLFTQSNFAQTTENLPVRYDGRLAVALKVMAEITVSNGKKIPSALEIQNKISLSEQVYDALYPNGIGLNNLVRDDKTVSQILSAVLKCDELTIAKIVSELQARDAVGTLMFNSALANLYRVGTNAYPAFPTTADGEKAALNLTAIKSIMGFKQIASKFTFFRTPEQHQADMAELCKDVVSAVAHICLHRNIDNLMMKQSLIDKAFMFAGSAYKEQAMMAYKLNNKNVEFIKIVRMDVIKNTNELLDLAAISVDVFTNSQPMAEQEKSPAYSS